MSKRAEFTPGPWVAKNNGNFWEISPEHGAGIEGPWDIGNVCSSDPSDPDGGLQEANALLIAAAPDLLDVAKVALLYANSKGNDLLSNMAERAIVKATGSDHERD